MLTSETTLVRIIAPCCLVLLSALQAKPNDLAPLSDEFVDAARITEWSRVHEVEQWNADQLEIYDVNDTPSRAVTCTSVVITKSPSTSLKAKAPRQSWYQIDVYGIITNRPGCVSLTS